jgi:hypothetical protein
MTPNMIDALKALYRSPAHLEHLPQKTALALKRAGFVHVNRIPSERGAMGRSPYYECKLTHKGKAYCEERFGPTLHDLPCGPPLRRSG